MRLFLAGVVPDAVKQTLHAQLEPVRAATPQARWLPADSLHLTLVFLGLGSGRGGPPAPGRLRGVVRTSSRGAPRP